MKKTAAEQTDNAPLPALNLTEEQKAILASTGNIRINAVAGSGKTTTIIQYAASRPKGSRILYLAFNKSVRLEAQHRFADLGLHNVQVETAHSLAYKHIVHRHGYRVCQQDYKTHELAEHLGLQGAGEKHGEFILANHISKFMAYFCNSSAERVQQLDYRQLVTDAKASAFVNNFYPQIELGTRLLLGKMHRGELPVTHDFYLKLFQLSKPQLPYDYILFDEGQDASPAMLDIFLKQPATKVIVGDTHQQIYGWRHAVNSLEKVDFAGYQLSTSFRFSQDIAHLSTEILSWKRHLQAVEPVLITGKGMPPKTTAKATIARTNLGLLLKAITFITEHPDVQQLYFEGNLHSYTYADEGASLYDVLNLYNGRREGVRDKLIGSMATIDDLEEYIEKTEDVQLGMMVEIVKEYGNAIPSLIQSLKRKHVPDEDKAKAEMIFSTVHRAKGMEYDAVQLVEDFVTEAKLEKLKADGKEAEALNTGKWAEEINLLYVAVTRTKGQLRIPEALLPKNFPSSPHIHVIKPVKEAAAKSVPNGSQTATFLERRLQQKNSAERWTPELDEELKALFRKGVPFAGMAAHFNCKKGTILARLRKLGCVDED